MKKIIATIVLLGLFAAGFAQPGPDDDRAESLRIAFLTNYLSLTPEESQQFWPVYNQMRDEAKVYMDAKRQNMEKSDFDKMSNEQLKQYIQDHMNNEQQLLDIRKKYAGEFAKVLPLKKVAMLTGAEDAFKRELLRHAKDRKEPPGGSPSGDRNPGGGGGGFPPPPESGFGR